MSDEKTCVICQEGGTSDKKLVCNPEMILELYNCCMERLSLGDLNIKNLTDYLGQLSENERDQQYYHSEYRKPSVNKINIERIRKRSISGSHVCSVQGPGRQPSKSSSEERPKRLRAIPKAEVCIFSICNVCPND